MRVTSHGHACLLVETADRRILLDPGTFARDWEGVTGLDAIVVTHQHPDHLDPERLPTLLAGNPDARLITEPQTADGLREKGIDVETITGGGPALDLGGVQLEPVGDLHAVIHADIPRIHNTGVVLRADGEATLFHPGDALDARPGGVDVLAVPVSAPWCAMKETVDFVRAIGARAIVPIHDALLSGVGRELYLRQIGNLGGVDGGFTDLRDAGPVSFDA